MDRAAGRGALARRACADPDRSAGRAALGDKPIPRNRVSLPYSIGDLLQDTPEKLEPVDRTQLATSIKALSTGLDSNPGSVDNIVEGVNSLLGQLTDRERDVLRLMGVGRSNAEIADELVIGAATVKTHVSSIFAKLQVRDRVGAVIIAHESGLVVDGGSAG